MRKYQVAETVTEIERFQDDENAVVIRWEGENRTIETYTRGYTEPLYVGSGMEAARESLDLTQQDFDGLLSVDVEYLVEVK